MRQNDCVLTKAEVWPKGYMSASLEVILLQVKWHGNRTSLVPIYSIWVILRPQQNKDIIVVATLCPTMLPVCGKMRQHCCVPHGHKKCF